MLNEIIEKVGNEYFKGVQNVSGAKYEQNKARTCEDLFSTNTVTELQLNLVKNSSKSTDK